MKGSLTSKKPHRACSSELNKDQYRISVNRHPSLHHRNQINKRQVERNNNGPRGHTPNNTDS